MKTFILALLVAASVSLPAQNISTNPSANRNISLADALKLYAEFTDRTVLRYPAVPDIKLAINLTTTNSAEIAHAIETAAGAKGIAFVPDGTKFILVAPHSAVAKLNPQAAKIPVSSTNDPASRIISKGSFHWKNASLSQALPIYAAILGQKFDSSSLPPQFRNREISFVNQTALTKAELSYAFETLFAWNGIKLVSAGDGLVRAVPVEMGASNPAAK